MNIGEKMFERKKKRKSIFDVFEEIFEEPFSDTVFPVEGGYSISITQVDGKTRIHVKADRNTNIAELKKSLKQQYPNAEIVIEGGKPMIEEVSREEREVKRKEEGKKKHHIVEID